MIMYGMLCYRMEGSGGLGIVHTVAPCPVWYGMVQFSLLWSSWYILVWSTVAWQGVESSVRLCIVRTVALCPAYSCSGAPAP